MSWCRSSYLAYLPINCLLDCAACFQIAPCTHISLPRTDLPISLSFRRCVCLSVTTSINFYSGPGGHCLQRHGFFFSHFFIDPLRSVDFSFDSVTIFDRPSTWVLANQFSTDRTIYLFIGLYIYLSRSIYTPVHLSSIIYHLSSIIYHLSSICLPIFPSICQSISQSIIYLPVPFSGYHPTCLAFYRSIYLALSKDFCNLFACLSIYLSTYLSMPVYVSICPSVYLKSLFS